MSRRVHRSADPPSGSSGCLRQLRTREGASLTERRPCSLLRPQEPLHSTTGHRPTHHQQGEHTIL